MRARNATRARGQRGMVAVEMGLVMLIFTALMFAIIELARLVWTWNAAAEATRVGARVASVCDLNDAVIKRRMRERLPALGDSNISIEYLRPGSASACVADDPINACRLVRVSLTGFSYQLGAGLLATPIAMPSMRTIVPREVMQSAGNASCS